MDPSATCDWSDTERGAIMPEPSEQEKFDLLRLCGYGDLAWDDRDLRLIREAYRHGWEAAQQSHDEWHDTPA